MLNLSSAAHICPCIGVSNASEAETRQTSSEHGDRVVGHNVDVGVIFKYGVAITHITHKFS